MPVEILEDARKRIRAPLSDDDVQQLEAGDVVLVSGVIYAARDAAHKRLLEMLDAGRSSVRPGGADRLLRRPDPRAPGQRDRLGRPHDREPDGQVHARMLELGLKGIIGKGGRGPAVRDALKERTAVYMAALGGGGALAALQIRSRRSSRSWSSAGGDPRDGGRGPPGVGRERLSGQDFYTQAVAPWRRDDLLPEEFRLGAGGSGGGLVPRAAPIPRAQLLHELAGVRRVHVDEGPAHVAQPMARDHPARGLLRPPGQPGC